MTQQAVPAEDPDIVRELMLHLQAALPDLDEARAGQIERDLRLRFGGLRVRIPKRGKHLRGEERDRAYSDGASSMQTGEVTRKHRISQATLYRILKERDR